MPSPVTRIAPKPSRFTVKSPPKLNVGFVAMFDDVDVSAPRITSDLPARSAAPLAKLIPRNLRRVTLRSWFRGSKFIRHDAKGYVHENRFQMQGDDPVRSRIRTSNASSKFFPKATMPPSCPAMTKIFLLRTSLTVEQAHNFVRHFRRAISNGLRSCRCATKKRRPQN